MQVAPSCEQQPFGAGVGIGVGGGVGVGGAVGGVLAPGMYWQPFHH
jgi:hypothetical protein